MLLSEGHAHARRYPLADLWAEARIVRRRFAQRATTEAVLTQAAILSMWSKEGGEEFQRVLRELNRDDG